MDTLVRVGDNNMQDNNNKRHYTMSKDAIAQRIKYGFKKDAKFSGVWTMVRMRPEVRDALKAKFGSLSAAFEYAMNAR